MKLTPFDTILGNFYPIEKYKEEYTLFLINNPEPLSYEFSSGDNIRLVFITGKNEEEKKLSVLPTILFIENFRGIKYLICDLRTVVNPKVGFKNLIEIVRDKNGFMFLITLSILTLDILENKDNNNFIQTLSSDIVASFTAWITGIFNTVFMLNIEEKLNISVVLSYYYFKIIYPDLSKSVIINKISKLKSVPVKDHRVIEDILINAKDEIKSIDDLIDLIKDCNVSDKMNNITVDVIFNIISNSWFGPNSKEMLIASFEHVPTLLSIIYVNLENNTYKKTRFAMLIKNNSRSIDTKKIKLNVEEILRKYSLLG